MSDTVCSACRRANPTVQCELCHDLSCKACAEILSEEAFAFLPKKPPELTHTRYCQGCWQGHVEPAQEEYRASLEQAKQAYIFFSTQRKPIPILLKEKDVIRVADCPDRDETILRLAFQAVRLGCNAVVETVVSSEKVRNGAVRDFRLAWTLRS
jgi:hypothetical protein